MRFTPHVSLASATMILFALTATAFAPPAPPPMPPFPPSDRRLMAWVAGGACRNPHTPIPGLGMKQVVAQLQRNPGFYTGVYGFCGYHFAANGTLYNNVSDGRLACCNGTADGGDLFAEVRRQNMEFHPVLRLDDPYATAANPQPFIDSFVARAKVEGWTGFNMDWEGHNTTGTLDYFLRFMKLNNAFADGLAAHGLQFTTDVQSVTQPWGYHPDAQLDAILGGTRAKLVQMDSYYYGSGRVLDALDFYVDRVPPEKLGIGMSSAEPTPTVDGFVARFHALRAAGVREVDMFLLPVNESWMPWLRKWKNDCRGCPNGGVLSCWANATCY